MFRSAFPGVERAREAEDRCIPIEIVDGAPWLEVMLEGRSLEHLLRLSHEPRVADAIAAAREARDWYRYGSLAADALLSR